jgi:hypothetical protein
MAVKIDYEVRMDKLFARGNLWKHRTLRTVFDPSSTEYTATTIDQKYYILKKAVENGEKLRVLIHDYKFRYLEQNRRDIAFEVENAIIILLDYQLKENQNSLEKA